MKWLSAIALVFGSCVNVSVEPIVKPSPPDAGWQVYQSADIQMGISLPPTWKVLPLTADLDGGLRSATPNTDVQTQLSPLAVQLRDAGIRFFAFDPSTPVGNFLPRQFPALAYMTRRSAPSSLEAFFASLPPEPTGRAVIDQKHVASAGGDMVIRRVRETRVRPDKSFELTVQYQCAVLRSGFLYILNMQVPDTALSDYEAQFEKIALSFAPF